MENVTKEHKHRKKLWTKEKLCEWCLKAIKDNPSIVYYSDFYKISPFTKRTFLSNCPEDSEERKMIQDALDQNRSNMKLEIRNRLLESNNVTALIVLYKLLGNEDERNALNGKQRLKDDKPVEETIEIQIQ